MDHVGVFDAVAQEDGQHVAFGQAQAAQALGQLAAALLLGGAGQRALFEDQGGMGRGGGAHVGVASCSPSLTLGWLAALAICPARAQSASSQAWYSVK